MGKLNIKKYAAKTGLAMALLDYLLYVEHNNRKALELCAEATMANEYRFVVNTQLCDMLTVKRNRSL